MFRKMRKILIIKCKDTAVIIFNFSLLMLLVFLFFASNF